MKLEPRELLNIVTEAAKDLVNEHSEFSEQILLVTKLLIKKISEKLFYIEASSVGLSEEEVRAILNSPTKEDTNEDK